MSSCCDCLKLILRSGGGRLVHVGRVEHVVDDLRERRCLEIAPLLVSAGPGAVVSRRVLHRLKHNLKEPLSGFRYQWRMGNYT